MTIQNETNKAVYIADGVNKEFVVPFYFLENHIAVYSNDTLVSKDDYIIAKHQGQGNGTVIFNDVPELGKKIIILRDVPLQQLVTFLEGENFPASDYETSLDKIIMALQQLKEIVSRSVSVPVNSEVSPQEYAEVVLRLEKQLPVLLGIPYMAEAVLNAQPIKLENIEVPTSDIEEDTTDERYPYHLDIEINEATPECFAIVIFELADVLSGIYAPINITQAGKIRIFLKSIPEASVITIPSITLF